MFLYMFQMSQEIGLIPKEDGFTNPYKEGDIIKVLS